MNEEVPRNKELFFVDAGTRFLAAQAEINSRIESKIQIQIYHFIAIGALLATFVTAMTINGPSKEMILAIIALAMPLTSSYFVALYVHNDRVIGILGAFAKSLEDISELEMPEAKLSRWHSEKWVHEALISRRWSNRATNFLALASPCMIAVSFFLSWNEKQSISDALSALGLWTIFSFFLATLIIIIIFFVLHRMDKFRDSIAVIDYDRFKREPIFTEKK